MHGRILAEGSPQPNNAFGLLTEVKELTFNIYMPQL